MPTGRARFAAGEVDVLVHGPVLEKGATVVVLAIDGPNVTVASQRPVANVGTT
jgi:hypothetical protein